MTVIVSNIKWDTDGEKIRLPKKIKVELADLVGEETISDLLSDLITEKTGFCHEGFSWDFAKPKGYAVTELLTKFRKTKDLVSVHTFPTKKEAVAYAKKRIETVKRNAIKIYGSHSGSLFDHHRFKVPNYEFVNLDGDLTELIVTKEK